MAQKQSNGPPALTMSNGVDNVSDELQAREGYMRIIRGAYYKQRDTSRLWLLPGRTLAGTLPSTTNVRDLAFLQYEGASTNTIIAWANSKIYEDTAGTSLSSWSTAQDQAASPADFSQTGSNPKAITDGKNRWVCWSGATDERPLVRDYLGNWRYLSLKKPSAAPTGTVLTSAGTLYYPDTQDAVTSYDEFSDQSQAYDTDEDTYASLTYSAADQGANDFKFTDAGNIPASTTLYIKLETSSLPPDGWEPPGGIGGGGGGSGGESLQATLTCELSEDSGSTWTTFFSQDAPVSTQTTSIQLTNSSGNSPRTAGAVAWTALRVRVKFVYTSGTTQVSARIREIWANDGGGATAITTGDYIYTVTEQVTVNTLSNSSTANIESAPSDTVTVTVSGTAYGVRLTLPDRSNLTTDGIADADIIRRVYRSTSTGAYPDLGLIGTADISDTEFTDDFNTSGTTLNSPGIDVLNVGGAYIPKAGQCPDFQDCTLFNGSLVAIPFADPYRIRWSYPGAPDYFPLPAHDLQLLPSDHNDKLIGIVAFNDALVVFLRNRVLRIQRLPIAGSTTFDLTDSQVEVLSHDIGLAGNNRGYATFPSPSGRELCAFVASNGLWMTDATLPVDRGMGLTELAPTFDWDSEVDVSALSTSRLTYDPLTQLLWFDYDNQSGQRRNLCFSVSVQHWVQPEAARTPVPKFTGPHHLKPDGRTTGEISGDWYQWSIESSTGKVFNERTGTSDAANWYNSNSDLELLIQSFWVYPFGHDGEALLYQTKLLHSDWTAGQACEIDVETRRDTTGVVLTKRKKGVSLEGSRVTKSWLSCGGQSFRFSLRYSGQGSGAIGPMGLEMELSGMDRS